MGIERKGCLKLAVVLLGSLGLFECVKEVAPLRKAPKLSNLAQAQSAVGNIVQVSGTAQREKLGDAVQTPFLHVRCQEPRFSDELIGKTVTVEGQLELVTEPAATVGPNGEISQGTESSSTSWVLRTCVLR